jgi:Rrf2 family protein
MLRIRRETDYAIRILIALARRPTGDLVSTEELGREMAIPRQYASRVIARLARGGFVDSVQGRGGGVRLARPAAEITLQDLVLYFEPVFVISECVNRPANCPFGSTCPVRQRWCRLQAHILQELGTTTIAELAEASPGLSTPEPMAGPATE